MKTFALAASAVLLSTLAAQADPLAVGYGNTVTVTGPDGGKTIIYVNADQTWEQHLANGTVLKGTFTEKDANNVCFTVTDPPPASPDKATNCNAITGDHKVGDTWTEKTPDGKSVTWAISAGRS